MAHFRAQHLNRNYVRPAVALLAAWLVVFPSTGRAQVQPSAAPMMLMLTLVEGEGAINNIRRGTAREPIVQVTDENRKPVAGASVLFALPDGGSTGTFANGARQLTVLTDSRGRAVAKGIRINNTPGSMKIQVTATKDDRSSQPLTISQTNLLGAHLLLGLIPVTAKSMVIMGAVAAGAIAAGVVLSGGSGNKISVGAPHF